MGKKIETHDYNHVSIRWIRISLLEIMHKYLPEGVSKELSMGHLPTTLSRVYSKFQLNIERARNSQWVNCNANSHLTIQNIYGKTYDEVSFFQECISLSHLSNHSNFL